MARPKRAARGAGRVTPPFRPTRRRDRIEVAPGISVRLVDLPNDLEPGSDAVVVPCCGNGEEFDALTGAGLPLVRYDVRNRGASSTVADARRLGFTAEVSDLATVCDVLELGRVSIVAWSYHTAVAVRFAVERPDRVGRLVLAAAIPTHSAAEGTAGRAPTPAQLAKLDQLQAEGLPSRDPEAWCAAWREVYVPLRMGKPEAFASMAPVCQLPNERPAHVAKAVISVLAELHPYDWRADLRALRPPVLVVHGTADPDPMEHAEEWVQVVPDARLLPLDGVGTLPWIEAPDRFFGVVNRFLAGDPV